MTRSHKYNDPHHGGRSATEDTEFQNMPKYFSKTGGHIDMDPKKTKKEGAGKANWGRRGDELLDDETVRMNKPRRRSNSLVDSASHFKTKFEAADPEPVFEEDVHGASEEDLAAAGVSPSRELPEGHDGFGFANEEDKMIGDHSSVGSSSFSVSGEDEIVGLKKN